MTHLNPLPDLPPGAFFAPDGTNRPAGEGLLRRALDVVSAYCASAAERSPLPEGDVPAEWSSIPEAPVEEKELLARLRTVMDGAMNAGHPGYVGHMDTIPSVASVIGDLACAALNNNMLSLDMSADLSRLEPRLLGEFSRRFGLGEKAGGLLISGGSLGNLEALVVARNVKLGTREAGLCGRARSPVLFASELCHTSIHKAAMVMGLGTRGVVEIPADARGKMDVGRLREAIASARREGREPFAVVATLGTTVTGNLDPVEEIAGVAREEGLWLHADSVYGGALILSDKHRARLKGIEQADSVTFNPQKWLYVTKTCAMVLFRDFGCLRDHFRVRADYMREQQDFVNLGEFSLQGTRHVDVLKLWLTLQHLGRRGLERLVDYGFVLRDAFVGELRRRPLLRLATEPELNLVCFRGEPDWLDRGRWDDWNANLQSHMLREGGVFFSLPSFRGGRWLKTVLLNPYTTPEQISAWFGVMDEYLRRRD